MTAALSVLTFLAIGQAINLAARTTTTAETGARTQTAVAPPSPTSASQGTATVSAASRTTTAVTSTHAS